MEHSQPHTLRGRRLAKDSADLFAWGGLFFDPIPWQALGPAPLSPEPRNAAQPAFKNALPPSNNSQA